MLLISSLFRLVVEALFPYSNAEKELFSYSGAEAYKILPRRPSLPVANTEAVFAYKDERVSRLVWNIKYKKSAAAVKIGGYALYTKLTELNREHSEKGSDGKIVLMPLPITEQRRKERGYNQCELIVNEIKRLDVYDRFATDSKLLKRVHHSSRQTLKGRAERLESAKGLFMADEKIAAGYSNETIIYVVDDVITTGSTIKEAMGTLRKVGFQNVRGISLAH